MKSARLGGRPITLRSALAVAGCGDLLVILWLGTIVQGLPPENASLRYERVIYPFDVLDPTGRPYDYPFLGGFNLPRPQLADIDGDGDLDLFVQEYSDSVMFFERLGDSAESIGDGSAYRWRTDRFADLDIGEWYLLIDIDDDGDLDLLTEYPYSRVRLYRNEGNATHPGFRLAKERLINAAGEELFIDRQNIPKIADLDCDGRLDLLVGKVEGTITRYEASSIDNDGAPVFRHLVDRFEEIEIIGQVLPAQQQQQQQQQQEWQQTKHGANTMALEDIDLDGDLDLFWGDFFEPGLLFIENTGSCRSPSLRSEPTPFPFNEPIGTSGYNAPAFGDLDSDGDVDLLVGVLGGAYNPNSSTIDNFLRFDQTESLSFDKRTARYIEGIDVGSESFPALADPDGDGDLDLFLGNKIETDDPDSGRLYWFENVGTRTEPRLQARGPSGLAAAYHFAPAFGDLDGDGDEDIVLGSWGDELATLWNEGPVDVAASFEVGRDVLGEAGTEHQIGGARYVVDDPVAVTITRGRNVIPALNDIDGDGDLDLFIGESSGQINFYRNVGSPQEPSFELVDDRYLGIDVGRRSAPALVDIDGDGDLDLVIGSEAEELALYRNSGNAKEPMFERDESFQIKVYPFATPAFADIDGDGDFDLLTGGIGGGVSFYENSEAR